jgi:hypothetical protein
VGMGVLSEGTRAWFGTCFLESVFLALGPLSGHRVDLPGSTQFLCVVFIHQGDV